MKQQFVNYINGLNNNKVFATVGELQKALNESPQLRGRYYAFCDSTFKYSLVHDDIEVWATLDKGEAQAKAFKMAEHGFTVTLTAERLHNEK